MLGAVQAYGIIQIAKNVSWITLTLPESFLTYAYIVTILVGGAMLVMWLGDQITSKGVGNGISVIIFAGIVVSLPNQITTAFQKWILTSWSLGSKEASLGVFRFILYILALVIIVAFVTFIELSKRKIPVQHSSRSGGSEKMSRASFLPIKVNSAGVIPVIFASSILTAPGVIASFISTDASSASWLDIFSYTKLTDMGNGVKMPWGLIIYLVLIFVFTFFYANLQINPERMADDFKKNGSYIPGIRPGVETERYVRKVLNRVTFIGAIALVFISALPVILTLSGAFGDDSTLAIGGTGLIIVVGVALEISNQINGLIAGKSYDEVIGGM